MNKISDNSKILKGCTRINLSDIEPVRFKETFITCFVFDSVMNETDLDTMVRQFFRLSILLSNTDHISNEQRSDIIQMLEGFYVLGKKILDAGGIEKIDPKILLDEFILSHILDQILDIETVTLIASNIFIVLENIALDELAFEQKERDAIICRFRGLLDLIEKLVKLKVHECESV